MDVLRLLDKEINAAQEAAKHNHKLAKVCFKTLDVVRLPSIGSGESQYIST